MTVLIIGDTCDPHVTTVRDQVTDMGCDCVVFDRNDPSHGLSFHTEENRRSLAARFTFDARIIEASAVSAVWWRIKQSSVPYRDGSAQKVADDFAKSEWRPALRSLPHFLAPDTEWVNDIACQDLANLKPWQLNLAASIGLQIPETFISNVPEAAIDLEERCSGVVYKTLSGYIFHQSQAIFTTQVSSVDMASRGDQIRRAPCIFQRLLNKSHELRITVVGEEVFAARIESQGATETSLDWRHDQLSDMYTEVEVPESLTRMILLFQRKSGLRFGAYDFAVDRHGTPWFLECNPAGQWLWIEERLGMPISSALARRLASREERFQSPGVA